MPRPVPHSTGPARPVPAGTEAAPWPTSARAKALARPASTWAEAATPPAPSWAGASARWERQLRGEVRGTPGVSVLTGGQTGVDTAAALAALRVGLVVHLVFPQGFRQEDGPITASRRRRLRGARMHELMSDEFRYRTWTAVYLSDAVVLIDPAGGDGCQETVRAAERLGRPLLMLSLGANSESAASLGPAPSQSLRPELLSAGQIAAWLDRAGARVLMVAGCRASMLAGSGRSAGLRAQVMAIAVGARDRHLQLLAQAQSSSS